MIEGLRAYPEVAATEVGWLSRLPTHWQVMRAKHIFREVDCRSVDGAETHLSMHQKLGLVPSASTGEKRLVSESYAGGKVVKPDDLVLNRLKAHLGVFAYASQPGVISPDYTVLRPLPNAAVRYYEYLLKSPACRGELRVRIKGIVEGFWRLYTDDFYDIRLPVPPLDEQRLIVRFLDWHGAMTGKLIRAKRRLIALLNEQKQSIIHRAVTRGLDPAAKLKPSGVDWLGDVPEHWEVKRLKWVVRLQRGYDLPADQRIDGTYPVVSSGGVIGKHVECRATAPGVVMGRYGSTDAVFFLDEDFWPHNTSLFVTDFQGNAARWCFHMLRTISKADHSGKSAVPGVDRKDLYEIMIAVPPQRDQPYIASAIDDQCAEFEDGITLVKDEIALIQEFRTRLIADVVTGQLDVRALAANLPEVTEADAAGELTDADDLDDDADALIEAEEAA